MKKFLIGSLFLAGILAAGNVSAADIKGRLGVTGRLGFLVPADSERPPGGDTIKSDAGFIGGGGLIYGIDRNVAVELDVTHTEFDSDLHDGRFGDFETDNVSVGLQYRFTLQKEKLVPFVGAGVDFLINDFTDADGTRHDVDTVIGMHLKGGIDYFINPNVALTAELKGILSPDADIETSRGTKVGNFDPSSFSMTFGARYFF